ncbi:hypothetical protein [Streptomyces mexicanus]|uniref:hypothetical protein n=1 Tax=Streptomyces mexicanus TaxID=178566 RepID=UPI0031E705F1
MAAKAVPAAGYRCQYVTDWVADKARWGLSVDADERTAAAQTLDQFNRLGLPLRLTRQPAGATR